MRHSHLIREEHRHHNCHTILDLHNYHCINPDLHNHSTQDCSHTIIASTISSGIGITRTIIRKVIPVRL